MSWRHLVSVGASLASKPGVISFSCMLNVFNPSLHAHISHVISTFQNLACYTHDPGKADTLVSSRAFKQHTLGEMQVLQHATEHVMI